MPLGKALSIRSPEDENSDFRETARGIKNQNDLRCAITIKPKVSMGTVVTATEKYLTAEAKVKEALMNLTSNFNGDDSNAYHTQKSKSVRLNDRTKSDELNSGYYGKNNEAMTNDVTPSLLK
jgi:hypothetical protein